jgi:hypothetical protein
LGRGGRGPGCADRLTAAAGGLPHVDERSTQLKRRIIALIDDGEKVAPFELRYFIWNSSFAIWR